MFCFSSFSNVNEMNYIDEQNLLFISTFLSFNFNTGRLWSRLPVIPISPPSGMTYFDKTLKLLTQIQEEMSIAQKQGDPSEANSSPIGHRKILIFPWA